MKSDFNAVEEELNQIENEFASGRMNAFGPASTQDEFLRDIRRIAEIETQVFYKMCSILRRGKEEDHGIITNMFASAQSSLSAQTPSTQTTEDGTATFEQTSGAAQANVNNNNNVNTGNTFDEHDYSTNSARPRNGTNSWDKTNSDNTNNNNMFAKMNMTTNDALRSITDATSKLPFTFPSRSHSPQTGTSPQKNSSLRGNSANTRSQSPGNASRTEKIDGNTNTTNNNSNNSFNTSRKGNSSNNHPGEWPNEAGFADKAFENVEAHFAILEGEFNSLGENLRQLSKHVMRLNEMSEQVNNMTESK